MKKVLILLISVLSFLLTDAQTYTSDVGGGNWEDNSTWTTTAPEPVVEWGATVNIQSVVYANELIEVELFGNLYILSDSLIAYAGLVTFIGADVTVNSGAVLYIVGDLDNTLWGEIIVNGTLKVDGNVSNSGSNIVVGTDGYVGIGGDFDNNGGTVENGNGGTVNVGGDIIGVDPEDNINSVTPEEALPIELLYFRGSFYNSTILTWATASEVNNDYFIVYYSDDAIEWKELDRISGAGNSSSEIIYNFNHYTKKSYYYKLKQVDYDGVNETFNLIFVQSVYVDMDRTYDVYDTNGRLIRKGKTSDIQDLKTGIYLLKYNQETHKIYID